jgi:hypothetical protein
VVPEVKESVDAYLEDADVFQYHMQMEFTWAVVILTLLTLLMGFLPEFRPGSLGSWFTWILVVFFLILDGGLFLAVEQFLELFSKLQVWRAAKYKLHGRPAPALRRWGWIMTEDGGIQRWNVRGVCFGVSLFPAVMMLARLFGS